MRNLELFGVGFMFNIYMNESLFVLLTGSFGWRIHCNNEDYIEILWSNWIQFLKK
jgi:hypothetical protein